MCDSYAAEIAVLHAQSQAFFAHPRHVGEFAILKDIKTPGEGCLPGVFCCRWEGVANSAAIILGAGKAQKA